MKKVAAALTCALLAACATSATRAADEAARRTAYLDAAGAPVNHFNYLSDFDSWQPLGDDLVVVYTRPNEAWLLAVPGCTSLSYARVLGVTSKVGQVSAGLDKVLTGKENIPCTIRSIRPVDVKAYKVAEARLNEEKASR